jgi:hypothetical protein
MILLATQVPTHKAILDVAAIKQKHTVDCISTIKGILYIETVEAVGAVVRTFGIITIGYIQRVFGSDYPIAITDLLTVCQ